MKRQNRQFTKFISLLKFPGLQYVLVGVVVVISVIAHRSLFYLDMVVHVAILVVRVPMIPDKFDE